MPYNKKSLALVFGGHVNGYSIVRELSKDSSINIGLIAHERCIGMFSNNLRERKIVERNSLSLKIALEELREIYGTIVIFPTSDAHIVLLNEIYDEICDFCFLPFEKNKTIRLSNKRVQYDICQELDLPIPKTKYIKANNELNTVLDMFKPPFIVKPILRKDQTKELFRNVIISSEKDKLEHTGLFKESLDQGIELVVSEIVPGDDTNIFAYTCYVDKSGSIKSEWVGKKLTQYPNNFGVVSSASSEFNEVVLEQGRSLVIAMDTYGIIEPEFRYDPLEKKYKLMEVNLRSMMWHGVGACSGVNLHLDLFYDVTNKPLSERVQDVKCKDEIHWVLMLHEISNVLTRPGYFKHFKYNVFGGKKRCWAIYSRSDIKPFLYSIYLLCRRISRICLKR
ncbi:hypothetical protein [Vibrio breoganii]|uniref:hypothetical protein n=1 Tax=Vibrio breoganii TaxID=553239 RepID=UPI001056929A|nr:hypothetical protein [Vibrio breoganii]